MSRTRLVKTPLMVLVLAVALVVPGAAAQAAPSVSTSAVPAAAQTAGQQTAGSQGGAALRTSKASRAKHKAKKAKKRARAKARARARAKARAAAIARAEAKKRAEAPVLTPPAPPATSGTLRVANANLKYNMSSTAFTADLRRVVAAGPDVVTLNEVAARTPEALTPAGYDMYRSADKRIKANAVLWRTDRWSEVEEGAGYLIDGGPEAQDSKRGYTWATLQGRSGQGVISVVSTHHMVNPAKFGPDKPLRQALYAQGMERLKAKVQQLSALGPVFVGGDFNSGFRENVAWSPRIRFAPIGVRAAMESMPYSPTHDGGGTIDYVFYQAARAVVTSQTVTDLNSDHHLLLNDFSLVPPVVEPVPSTGTTGVR